MLLAAAGEVQSQGAAALAAAQRAKVAAQQQARQQRAEQGEQGEHAASHSASPTLQARTELWCKTGIASLRDLQLAELPPGLLSPALSSTLRVMDLSGNKLTGLPGSVAGLQALQRLRLSMNCLGDEGTWAPLLQLSQLAVLDVSHNRLTTLPEGLSRLAALQKLAASNNAIGAIPATVGALTALRVLSLSHNQLRGLPAKLGACTALEEAGLSGNQIPEIPDSLSALHSLKLLDLDANRIKHVPSAVLRHCSALGTLRLHDNPITVEELRGTPGYLEFDSRRRAKYDKQVGMKLHGEGFDEGVDIHEFEHWNP